MSVPTDMPVSKDGSHLWDIPDRLAELTADMNRDGLNWRDDSDMATSGLLTRPNVGSFTHLKKRNGMFNTLIRSDQSFPANELTITPDARRMLKAEGKSILPDKGIFFTNAPSVNRVNAVKKSNANFVRFRDDLISEESTVDVGRETLKVEREILALMKSGAVRRFARGGF